MATAFQFMLGLVLLSLYFLHSTSKTDVYIVYLGINGFNDPLLTSHYHVKLLCNVFESEKDAEHSMVYSYRHSFSGFSAMLNATQAATLAKMKGVVSVFKSKVLHLHTTRSWDFMGLTLDKSEMTIPLQLAYGEDIVIGIFDTGIWPEAESFQPDTSLGPVPSYWKGRCDSGQMFDPATACNGKLIGARYYLKGFQHTLGAPRPSSREYRSARDFLGHGTHTASTAAGSVIGGAAFFGLGRGTARGGAPRARLAAYKVCWSDEDLAGSCAEADALAAFDDAISDGVRVISASFGPLPPLSPFFKSGQAIGAFHAAQMGVSVVFSAGNEGPDPSLVTNVAPWAISVAASTLDRTFPTQVLVNGSFSMVGESFTVEPLNATLARSTTYFFDGVCSWENWRNRSGSEGRVILCFSTAGWVSSETAQLAVKMANASGLIFAEPMTKQLANVDLIPTIRVDISQGTKIRNYLALSVKFPTVQIRPSTTVTGKSPAPAVAYFSSRGPNTLSPDILKPDLSGPGVNVLAAWPPKAPPSMMPWDQRSVNWNFLSGTSMSCPHVSGAVALLRSAHPLWSAAAIRSALMTTAYNRDTTQDSILAGGSMKVSDPFEVGSGHINPSKAIDPGLIYDVKTDDYVLFLCNMGYTDQQIALVVLTPPGGTNYSCPKTKNWYATNSDLNYPSITVSDLQSARTIRRTVHNVGQQRTAVYFVSVLSPHGVEVVVWPRLLVFTCHREEASYYVTLRPRKRSQGRYDFGHIVWSDGFHHVRSPLVVLINTAKDMTPAINI